MTMCCSDLTTMGVVVDWGEGVHETPDPSRLKPLLQELGISHAGTEFEFCPPGGMGGCLDTRGQNLNSVSPKEWVDAWTLVDRI